MTTTISEEYIRLNAEIHKASPGYGNSANRFAKDIGDTLSRFHTMSFLDYGCGKESLYRCLQKQFPFLVRRSEYGAYDPAIVHRAQKPNKQYDMVVSTDVLEHIEPEYLVKVLEEIRDFAKKGVYLNICMRPSGDVLSDGRNAHLIVQNSDWWKATLSEVFIGWSMEVRNVLDSWRNFTVVLRRPIKEQALNIVCFYWKGTSSRYPGWNDEILARKYINNLYRGVNIHLKMPFKFITFTNEFKEGVDSGIEIRPFVPLSWTGCFPKLYAHSPAAELTGRVLVFDLDTIIVGDITDFGKYDGAFTTRMEPTHSRVSAGDLLGFTAGETFELWENYKIIHKYVEKYEGDEREIYNLLWKNLLYWQEEIPGQLVSYKRDVLLNHDMIPKNARIISAHGRPRPHEIKNSWISRYWRA